jgi:hypothetical protein
MFSLPFTFILLWAGHSSTGSTGRANAFVASSKYPTRFSWGTVQVPSLTSSLSSADEWNGDVVSNMEEGKIRGCTMQKVGDSLTEWTLTIDGVDADLGRFSEAIYKKMMGDAKQQRFQGFRPGTIPPHLEPTYRARAMDECARETVLEAMQQNNVRPFESTRNEILLEDFSVPPPQTKKKGKKRKKTEQDSAPEDSPQWLSFPSMKEAINAGWRPGQSFSFVAKNVKGQQVNDKSTAEGTSPILSGTDGATPLGLNF